MGEYQFKFILEEADYSTMLRLSLMIMLVVVGGGYSSPIIGKHIGNLLKGIFESKPTTVNTPRPTHPRGYRRIRPTFRPAVRPAVRPVQVQPVSIPTVTVTQISN